MAKKKTASTPEPLQCSFEEALKKLEQIVSNLEEGQLGLAESLTQYEQGMRYLQHCYGQLDAAERKIELLTGQAADGEAQTEPFDEEQVSLETKQATRSQRRSRPGNAEGPASLF